MRKYLVVVSVFLATVLLSGCSNKQMMSQESGFLLKYNDLQDSSDMQGAKFYVAKDVDFSKYMYLYIAPVQILHNIPKSDLTPKQKQLFKQMENYLTMKYKVMIQGSDNYKLVNEKTQDNTLVFEGAISAVEIHQDDMGAMDIMPMMLVLKAVSSPFKDSTVRLLGEGRISDAKTGKILVKTLRLHNGKKVSVNVNNLSFKDLEPALNDWIKATKNNLIKLKNSMKKS